jgi:DNA-binding CsgD family transcriptional regulator/PAS domain-containing protein
MAIDDDILALITSIYDAAIDETLWPETIQRLIAVVDCPAASFCIIDSSEQPRMPIFIPVNFRRDHIDEYLDYMVPHDPTVQHIVAHPEQKIHHDSTFIGEREKDRHLYFDWHHRFSDTRHRIAGIIHPAPQIQTGITVHRTRGQGDFTPELLARFTMLFQHIERALQIGFRLGTLNNLHQVSLAMLDSNPLAIILLDDHGHVILVNRAARELVESLDGVMLSDNIVALAHRTENTKLQQMIASALKARSQPGVMPGGAMSAMRPSGKRPFAVMVSPLSPNSFTIAAVCPAVCVVFADPERRPALPTERLRAVYGLTPSEARLAVHLASGEDLRAVADKIGIRYSTARTQLAAIFRKTETSRQGELVRLLMTFLPFQV